MISVYNSFSVLLLSYRDCDFREFMLEDAGNRERLFRCAEELPSEDTLVPELERIFEPRRFCAILFMVVESS